MPTTRRITRRKATGAEFTPPDLARLVANRLGGFLREAARTELVVLDPSCGDGELLAAFVQVVDPRILAGVALVGIDEDSSYADSARERLLEAGARSVQVIQGDFLEFVRDRTSQKGLFAEEASLPEGLVSLADVIIANPPYVRTQNLGASRAQQLARAFDLTGRVDLYHAFLVAMTRQLRPGGLLGVITSNRFLMTRGGAATRKLLASQFEVLEVLDLGDTKLFEASVLPAVFIGQKKQPASLKQVRSARFVKIYEEPAAADTSAVPGSSVCSVLEDAVPGEYRISGRRYKVETGFMHIPQDEAEPWSMTTTEQQRWIKQIDSHASGRLSDFAQVRVGIKTTADEVFIRTDWDELLEILRPEEELLRPLLSHEIARRWSTGRGVQRRRRILYTHEVRDGQRVAIDLKKYPAAQAYLQRHKKRLEARRYVIEAGRNWYEIWVPQDPNAWPLPKLVFPDISPRACFYYDDAGHLVDGDCYWITLRPGVDEDVLFLVLGIANSELMLRYHDLAFNNRLYSGRRRFLTQYVERYPVPDPTSAASRKVIQVVRQLVALARSSQPTEELESQLEGHVRASFGVSNGS
jgi:tRNA1(Val) A37 N6-methylase TrmN6